MTRRVLLLPGLIAVHLLLLAMLLANGPPIAAAPAATAIAVRAVALRRPPVEAPAIGEANIAASVDAPVIEIAAASTGSDCRLTETLQVALNADPAVTAALAATTLPGTSSVMLWDGQWPALASDSRTPLAAARRIVAAGVETASPDCRTAVMAGPRLMFLADGDRRITVAIGSGMWSWGDLI